MRLLLAIPPISGDLQRSIAAQGIVHDCSSVHDVAGVRRYLAAGAVDVLIIGDRVLADYLRNPLRVADGGVMPMPPTVIVTDATDPAWPTWSVPWRVAVVTHPVQADKLAQAMAEVSVGR